MKIRIAAALAALIMTASLAPLPAQTPSIPEQMQSQGLKIGFVNFAQVLEGTEEAKGEIAKVLSYMEDKQKEFDAMSTEVENLKQQMRQQERALNPETLAEMQNSIREKEKNLRRFQEDTQSDINSRRDGLFARLSTKVQVVLEKYAREQNYSAVFFLDSLQGYFDPGLNVTQEIIRLYNEQHPVAAASSP